MIYVGLIEALNVSNAPGTGAGMGEKEEFPEDDDMEETEASELNQRILKVRPRERS